MKKSFKFLAMALCAVLVMSVCFSMFTANTKTSAVDYKEGEWVTKGTTFKFDGKDYTVSKDENYSGEYITVDDTVYYLISDVEDIKSIANCFADASFIIANDIELGVWTEKVGAYVIIIEGCGHKITFGEGSTLGLFDSFAGNANNLILEGTIVSDQKQVAGFTKTFMDGTLDGIVNNADITSTVESEGDGADSGIKVAGIASVADLSFGNFVIKNCVNNGDITGECRVAGIIANMQTSPWNDTSAAGSFTMRGCENNGTITSHRWGPGGLLSIVEFYGTGEVKIINSHNNGDVIGRNFSGGIVGTYIANGAIEACTNSGNVSSVNDCVGGIAGRIACGENATVSVSNCGNTGAISSEKNNVAGVVGLLRANNITFSNVFSVGTLTPGSVTNEDTSVTTKTAYGITTRENANISTFAEKCFYTGADKGMNKFDQEADIGMHITADQVSNGYIATQFNEANEAAGNEIRWSQTVGTDAAPILDQSTLIETTVATTKRTTSATTTAASTTKKPDATTKAPINASTTAAGGAADEEEKGGCGSSIAVASVLLLSTALTGTTVIASRKRR